LLHTWHVADIGDPNTMNTRRCFASIICLGSFCVVHAAHNLDIYPDKIQLGTIHIGQKVETVITLKNQHNKPFIIKDVRSSCGCEKPIVDFNSILPSEEQSIKVLSFPKKEGKYRHKISIIPKTEEFNPASILIEGNVIQTLHATIGWSPGEISANTKAVNDIDLGVIKKREGRILHIVVTTVTRGVAVDSKQFEGFRSRYFELVKNSVKDCPLKTGEHGIQLNATLRRDVSDTGFCKDDIEIWLDKERMVNVPIKCRIVGDVYVSPGTVYLGKLDSAESPGVKTVSVFFTSSATAWKDLSWRVDGELSQAVDVRVIDTDGKDNCSKLSLSVKQAAIDALPNGFIHSILAIWDKGTGDDRSVKVLIYAFNSR
jgi:hypothetical protein